MAGRAAAQRLPRSKAIWLLAMDVLFTALGLVLIIEGLLPFLSPKGWRGVFEQVLKLSDGQIRFYGLASMLLGLVIVLIL
jgi:uncharacterized protein